MNASIELLKKSRAFALQLVEGLSDETLNTIPKGFSNNIIWNLAHLVAAEQGVLYLRSGAPLNVPAEFYQAYTRGAAPQGTVAAADIAAIKDLLTSTLPKLEADYDSGSLPPYKPWTTPYSIELTSIDAALEFLIFHEGLHCGYIMALKRAVAAEQTA